MRRVLAANWSSERTEKYARDIIKGTAKLKNAELEVESDNVSLFTRHRRPLQHRQASSRGHGNFSVQASRLHDLRSQASRLSETTR